MAKLNRTTVFVKEVPYSQLKALAYKKDRSVGYLIRKGIDLILAKNDLTKAENLPAPKKISLNGEV